MEEKCHFPVPLPHMVVNPNPLVEPSMSNKPNLLVLEPSMTEKPYLPVSEPSMSEEPNPIGESAMAEKPNHPVSEPSMSNKANILVWEPPISEKPSLPVSEPSISEEPNPIEQSSIAGKPNPPVSVQAILEEHNLPVSKQYTMGKPNLLSEPSMSEKPNLPVSEPSILEEPNHTGESSMARKLNPPVSEPSMLKEPNLQGSELSKPEKPNLPISKSSMSENPNPRGIAQKPSVRVEPQSFLVPVSEPSMPNKPNPNPVVEKPYLRVEPYRFLVLVIFCLNSTMNGMTVLQFTTIRKEIMFFYDVDDGAADWTTLLFGVSNAVLLFPSAWFFETKGLRWALGYGVIFNALGHGVKCFCFEPSSFYLLLVGQSVCSLSRVFIFPTPSRLAADWFPAGEVSVASAVAVLSYPVGTALSYLVASLVIIDVNDIKIVQKELQNFQYGMTGAAVLILILTFIVMRDKPEFPPSVAAALRREEEVVNTNYITSIKRFMKNKNFLLHLVSFAFNVSTLNIINVVFTQILSTQFPGQLKEIGWLGFYYTMIGVGGAVFSGFLLDRFHRYKLIAILMYVTSVIACVLLTVMNRFVSHVNWLYFPATLIGISFMSYMSVGCELGAEITYPESKSTMAGLLYTLVQVFGLVFLPVVDRLSKFFPNYVDIFMMSCFTGLLFLGLLIAVFVKGDYRRQETEKRNRDGPRSH